METLLPIHLNGDRLIRWEMGELINLQQKKELNTNLGPGVFPGNLGESGPNSFTTHTTGYWPVSKARATAEKGEAVAEMEGGDEDMKGNLIYPMHTIDAVEAKLKAGQLGPDDYVAVAMDSGAYPYGTNLTSPDYPGIPFRVVDTGEAFDKAGVTKLDIATSQHDRMTQLTKDNVRFDRVGGGIGAS